MKKYKVTNRFVNEISFIIEAENRWEATMKFREQINSNGKMKEYEEIKVEDEF